MGKERRSASEIREILQGYEESGLTRRQYCSQIGLPVTTFDYYRNRWQGGGGKEAEAPSAKQFLPQDELRRIFDPFMRGESVKQGSGIGLAIARAAIEAQGGNLDAESLERRCSAERARTSRPGQRPRDSPG